MTTASFSIVFLIRSLETGGAQRQLVHLARGLAARGHKVAVAVFYRRPGLAQDLIDGGVEIADLAKTTRWDLAGPALRLARLLRHRRADIIHGYMPAENIFAAAAWLFARPFLPGLKLVFGVRAGAVEGASRSLRQLLGVETFVSRAAACTIVNSDRGRQAILERGFAPDRIAVIPNGIDTDRFHPDPAAGMAVRAEFSIAPDERVIGMVARLDPVKDHETLFDAFAIALKTRPELRLMIVGGLGDQDPARLTALQDRAAGLGIASRVVWTGDRADAPAVVNAFDIATLTSVSEGFPNVLAEAMACGKPCVATDVGAARMMVGDAGLIVPPQDPAALAQAWLTLLDRLEAEAASLAPAARARIEGEFSLNSLTERTERLLGGLVGAAAR